MTRRYSNDQDLIKTLRMYIERHFDKKKDAAEHWGVSGNYLSMILSSTKPPTKEILDELGYERVKMYKFKD